MLDPNSSKDVPFDCEKGSMDNGGSPTSHFPPLAVQPQTFDSTRGEPRQASLQAWLQVAGCFLLSFNSWGIIYSFGAFQTFYQVSLLEGNSPSTIAWLGSIQAFILGVVGLICGPLYGAGYLRSLVATGSTLLILGLVAMSFCSTWWQLLLAQSFCIGMGCGFLYVPSVAVPAEYFQQGLGLAMGIAQSGGAVGGIVYPLLFQELQPIYGFAWSVRAMALICVCACVVSAALLLVGAYPKRTDGVGIIFRRMHHAFDLAALKQPSFALFVLASFTSDLGLFGPTTYIGVYAQQVVSLPIELASALLPVMNSASVFGRILPAVFMKRAGALTLLIPTATFAGALTLAWIAIGNTGTLFVFAALYGAMYGAYIVLPEVALADMTHDLTRLGPRIGMCGLANALGSLVGTPSAGALLSLTGNHLGVQLFTGAAMILTGTLMFVVHCVSRRERLRKG